MFCSSVAVLRSNLKVLYSLLKCEKKVLKVVERKKNNENMGVTRRRVRPGQNCFKSFFFPFFLTINRAIIFWWADWSRVMVKELIDHGIVACYRRSVLIQSSVLVSKWRGRGKRRKKGRGRDENGVIFV